jgi:hypothetical protein
VKRLVIAGLAGLFCLGVPAAAAGPAAASAQAPAAQLAAAPAATAPAGGPTALRGECTLIFCGWVGNSSSSATYIVATDNWPPSNGNWQYLYPGQGSPFRDTDGFYVPTGCRAVPQGAQAPPTYYGGQWHKISDLFSYTVRVSC